MVRRDPRRADRHRDHEPVLDGQPVGQSGGHGRWHRYPAHLCPGFWDHYLLIGGVGSTLPLALMLLRKAVHLRTIGRMGVVPRVFNINEPILFGAPIIMNPLFFLPFVLVPMVNATLAYFALKLDLVSRVVSMTPWTTPAPIGASWAANWSFSPVILCLICMATAMVMYLPFLKAYEKQLLARGENAVGGLTTRRKPLNANDSEDNHGIRRTGDGDHHQCRAVT
ncbi:Lichenan permease IIC component [Klebsiella pneumoniae]|nr:Lichenan permease IIC component [Klebsiella pneumoniae]